MTWRAPVVSGNAWLRTSSSVAKAASATAVNARLGTAAVNQVGAGGRVRVGDGGAVSLAVPTTRIPAVPAEGALTFAADQAIPLARGDLGLLLHPVPHRGLGEIEALGDLTGRAVTLPA